MTQDLQANIDPNIYQVFLCTCPAHMPFVFAAHPWFVINKQGDVSRWEVRYYQGGRDHESWGHLHKDALNPFSGLQVFTFSNWLFWPASVLERIDGPEARKVIDIIEASPEAYPHIDTYQLWGPNSNTYAQWILNKSGVFHTELPGNAVGKSRV